MKQKPDQLQSFQFEDKSDHFQLFQIHLHFLSMNGKFTAHSNSRISKKFGFDNTHLQRIDPDRYSEHLEAGVHPLGKCKVQRDT